MHLKLARFRAADSAWFTHSHGPLTSHQLLIETSQNMSKQPVVL